MNDGKTIPLQHVILFERIREPGSDVVGIVLESDGSSTSAFNLDTFFASLTLNAVQINVEQNIHNDDSAGQSRIATEAIVDHFENSLKYSSEGDMWHLGGRDVFYHRVRHFTSRGKKVEFCLPAFPCKSSNLNKVQGTMPNRGEYIALMNLYDFIEGVEKIYEPDAKLWIISDGHVFSDCIGVDDSTVDIYGAQLIHMNRRICNSRGGVDRVGFKSLLDIFDLATLEKQRQSHVAELSIPDISHHIATKLLDEAEICRRILMLGFQADRDELRRHIDFGNATILALYRGFSRFMLEDLELNIYTTDLTRSQRRRLSAKVAFEMIQRNQAYSNLVEMVFPHHIRLSIHSHPNIGPKFGIRLFGAPMRPTNILSSDGEVMSSHDLLHIPTPWHNCMVEVEGHPTRYITKSGIARSALSSGRFSGAWTDDTEPSGGFFLLTSTMHVSQECSICEDTHLIYSAVPSRLNPAKEVTPDVSEASTPPWT